VAAGGGGVYRMIWNRGKLNVPQLVVRSLMPLSLSRKAQPHYPD
jgi:hypothetical protein